MIFAIWLVQIIFSATEYELQILSQDFSDGLQRQIQELKTDAESSERALAVSLDS